MLIIDQTFKIVQFSLGGSFLFQPQEILSLVVGFIAIILVVLSLVSYRRTKLRMLLLVSIAFALFAAKTLINHLNTFVLKLGAGFENTLFSMLDLLILFLFFTALVIGTGSKRATKSDQDAPTT